MGLSFNYEFRLPPSWSSADVDDVLARLKRRAEQARFTRISSTYVGVVEFLPDKWRHVFNVFAEVNARLVFELEREYVGDASTARGFLATPGRGCEAAAFGFMRRVFPDDDSREWFWEGWCKTQYASVHGEQHFVDCHLRLVHLMEFAIDLGVDVTVWDEGRYWDTRDRTVLLAELDKVNRLTAFVAGRVHDAGRTVHAPIHNHPDFERLEG